MVEMLVHLRIDNRLIHGQVVALWVKAVGADSIVVANDEVAADPIQKMMLPVAAGSIKTLVLSVAGAAEYIRKAPERERILVVAKYPGDALALLETGIKAEAINIGNQAAVPGTKFEKITNTVAVTREDAAVYAKIVSLGYTIGCKMVPDDGGRDFLGMLKARKLL
jgi:mannose/fructose/N-acetylgalactosamine-specific phosphotransferase system component IIB